MSTTCTSNGKDIKLHNNNSMWHTKMLSKPSSPMAEIYYRLFKSDVLPSVTKHGSNVEQTNRILLHVTENVCAH